MEISDNETSPTRLKVITFQILGLLIDVLGSLGGLLVLYGWIAAVTKTSWTVLDAYATGVATYSTLAGTVLLCASIYNKTKPLPPSAASIFFTAPVVVICILGSVIYSAWMKVSIPIHSIIGFAILGLAGGLHRQFRTEEAQR